MHVSLTTYFEVNRLQGCETTAGGSAGLGGVRHRVAVFVQLRKTEKLGNNYLRKWLNWSLQVPSTFAIGFLHRCDSRSIVSPRFPPWNSSATPTERAASWSLQVTVVFPK